MPSDVVPQPSPDDVRESQSPNDAAEPRITELLTPDVVRSWARLAAGALGRDRELLDSANVFPVPDGDTGTNLHLTARGGAQAVAAMPPDASSTALLAVLARGALIGARGNSGVILAEWFRGLASAAAQRLPWSQALLYASDVAHQAVAKPAEGTILTAAEDAAVAAQREASSPEMAARRFAGVEAAVAGARHGAEHSPERLPQLAKAGVLDAGASGLVLVLDALRAVLEMSDGPAVASASAGAQPAEAPGESLSTTAFLAAVPVSIGLDLGARRRDAALPADEDLAEHYGGDEDEFEVMFTLWRPANATGFAPGQVAAELRKELTEIGDSVVVVGGSVEAPDTDVSASENVWHAHVHVHDLAAARELVERWRVNGRVEQTQVRYLAVPNSDLTTYVTTTTPALADEFSRAGAVVLAKDAAAGAFSPTELAEAALASATPMALLLVPGGPRFAARVQREVDRVVAETDASGALNGAGALPTVRVLSAPSDAAATVALGVLAETDGQGATQQVGAVASALDRTEVFSGATLPSPSGKQITGTAGSGAVSRALDDPAISTATRFSPQDDVACGSPAPDDRPPASSCGAGVAGIAGSSQCGQTAPNSTVPDITQTADPLSQLQTALASAGPGALVTALLDADVPDDVEQRLQDIAGENSVVIPSGRPGTGVQIAVTAGG